MEERVRKRNCLKKDVQVICKESYIKTFKTAEGKEIKKTAYKYQVLDTGEVDDFKAFNYVRDFYTWYSDENYDVEPFNLYLAEVEQSKVKVDGQTGWLEPGLKFIGFIDVPVIKSYDNVPF